MVTAAPEDQRLALGVVVKFQDLAHKDSMVAAIIGEEFFAFENSQRAGQNGAAGFPDFVVNAAPLIAG